MFSKLTLRTYVPNIQRGQLRHICWFKQSNEDTHPAGYGGGNISSLDWHTSYGQLVVSIYMVNNKPSTLLLG